MSHTRRALAPAALVVLASLAGTGHAFTLQRLASSIDLEKLASTVSPDPAKAIADGFSLEPAATELLGASTEFRVTLPTESEVTMEVTDEAGTCVCSARMHMPSGIQKLGFSGYDVHGRPLANGIYHYTVTAGNAVRSSRVAIFR